MSSSSSSSAPAPSSRSPSPATPEPFQSFDPVAIHSDLDLYNSRYLSDLQVLDVQAQWDISPSESAALRKLEDDQMLHLDELIEQHAYDEYVLSLCNFHSQLLLSL